MKKFCKFVKNHTGLCSGILIVVLLCSVVLGVGLGPVRIPFTDVWKIIFHNLLGFVGAGDVVSLEGIRESTGNIVWFLRLPRVILGGLVGASLTLAGVGMQAFTKNPLADPYVLGISSGASLGAAAVGIPLGAFLGALLSMVLVYILAAGGNTVTPVRLVLVGVAVSAMFGAFTNYIVYTAPDDASVREATFWMLGGFGSAKWSDVPIKSGAARTDCCDCYSYSIFCGCKRMYRICRACNTTSCTFSCGSRSQKASSYCHTMWRCIYDMGGCRTKDDTSSNRNSSGNPYSISGSAFIPLDGKSAPL